MSMGQHKFTNPEIDLACGQVEKFLSVSGVEHREALRIKLTFEEILLDSIRTPRIN